MTRIKSSEKKAYIEQIVAWNKEGISQYEIADRLGKTQSSISLTFKRNGITPVRLTKSQYGSANPNYKGGLSRATVSRETKIAVKQSGRDLFTCERCGSKRDLELPRHHKDRNKANNISDNIEILCVSCHNREHMPERERDSAGRLL